MNDQPHRHTWRAFLASVGKRYGAAHNRIRRQMLREDPTCTSCGEPGSHADHKTPLCLGGETTRENMQILCVTCSRSKTAREANYVRWHVKRGHLDRGNGPGAGRKTKAANAADRRPPRAS